MKFPKSTILVEDGITKKLHTGMQFSLNVKGEIFDFGIGEAKPQIPMTGETVLPWLSSAKPILVVALARQVDAGKLAWDTPCYRYFPEWGYDSYRSQLTITHLLTHTAGLEEIDHGWPLLKWEESIRRVTNAPYYEGIEPGKRAAYSPQVNWFLLGEILCQITGKKFATAIQELVIEPLNMVETRCYYLADDPLNTRRGDFYERVKGELNNDVYQPRLMAQSPSPGSSFCGPAHDLRKVMDLLLNKGKLGDEQFIREETVREITSRQRVDLFDHTLQHKVDYGLGVIINSSQYGMETVPYGFGRLASNNAFGHGGAQSSQSFVDPEFQLSGVIIANGRAGEGQHQRRMREIITAVYEDLQLN